MKIFNKDKNINITYELSVLQEEYNGAKQQYEETKNVKFLHKMNELNPKIENLLKMKLEREEEELNKNQIDRIAQINRKTLEKQKQNDLSYSMIHKKRQREDDIANPYKRKDCKPINLFDSGYLKKDETKTKLDTTQNMSVDQEEEKVPVLEHKVTLRDINEKLNHLSNKIDELVKLKKENTKPRNEDAYLYDILKIPQKQFIQMINTHNEKYKKDYKLLTLDQIEY